MMSVRNSRHSVGSAPLRGVDRYDIPAFLRRADEDSPMDRLTRLIEGDPSRLQPKEVFQLLREAGFIAEFDDLFGLAKELGLNLEAIAAIVIAQIFESPQGDLLSADSKDAAASLRRYARRAKETLEGISRRAEALMEITSDPIAYDLLESGQFRASSETVSRYARVGQLLVVLRGSVRSATEKYKGSSTAIAAQLPIIYP